MAVAALNQSGRGTQIFAASGDWLPIGWGWGFAVAINPARDFGPRLFAWIAGWGKVAMPGDYGNVNTYLWIPIVGPLIGGLIGALVYDLGIRDTLLARGETRRRGARADGRRSGLTAPSAPHRGHSLSAAKSRPRR